MKYYNPTTLLFKNGEWIKRPEIYVYPFEYADAGVIHTVNGEKIYDHLKCFNREDDAFYMRDGLPYTYAKSLDGFKGLMCYLKWTFRLKKHCGYYKWVGVYEKDDVTVYIFRDFLSRSSVSFYKDATDTYILYGQNDACHSMLSNLIGNDYGDEIERIITNEIYDWCYENALTWISDLLYDNHEERLEGLSKLCQTFVKKEKVL